MLGDDALGAFMPHAATSSSSGGGGGGSGGGRGGIVYKGVLLDVGRPVDPSECQPGLLLLDAEEGADAGDGARSGEPTTATFKRRKVVDQSKFRKKK